MVPDPTLVHEPRSSDRASSARTPAAKPSARRALRSVAASVLITACVGASALLARVQDPPRVDAAAMIELLSALSHDSMAGRRTGTEGGARAQALLVREMDALALDTLGGSRAHPFTILGAGSDPFPAANVLGMIPGTERPTRYIVVSAHFDHLGIRGGEIFNGADDNASGTAALLALARVFGERPPRHSIVFAALDAEEMGLRGARAFLDDAPIDLDSILANVNLDMVSRSEVGELYAAGTSHYPFLAPLLGEVAARSRITLLLGHDTPDLSAGDDWTSASDHGVFHAEGIPFVYFGVEDHEGYHRPSDTFENVTRAFYVDAVNTIADFLISLDRDWETIRR